MKISTNFCLACASIALLGTPVTAAVQDAPGRLAPATDPEAKDPGTVVCKRMEPTVGTRLGGGKRVCQTNLAWQKQEQAAKDATRENQRSGMFRRQPG